jgi:hypothetical protein
MILVRNDLRIHPHMNLCGTYFQDFWTLQTPLHFSRATPSQTRSGSTGRRPTSAKGAAFDPIRMQKNHLKKQKNGLRNKNTKGKIVFF